MAYRDATIGFIERKSLKQMRTILLVCDVLNVNIIQIQLEAPHFASLVSFSMLDRIINELIFLPWSSDI